jgi:hypothetical protein
MEIQNLPSAVQKLASLGDAWKEPEWLDYLSLGLDSSHIPLLINIVEERAQLWNELAGSSDSIWMPVHAWRALAQLQASPAVPALLNLLHEIDDDGNEIIQEDLPDVLAQIGPSAMISTGQYLQTPLNPLWARISAAYALRNLARAYPETRSEVTALLEQVLEYFLLNDRTLNGFLTAFLADLQSAASSPVVEQAYLANRVDESILGDFEDYQVAVGLLERRLTPRRRKARLPAPPRAATIEEISQTDSAHPLVKTSQGRRKHEKFARKRFPQKKRKAVK